MRITRLLILIILAVLLESCAKQDTVQNVTRYRSWNFDSSAASGEARAAFIPKGAYIIASTEQAVPDKSWVRLIPGGAWPAEEPRPTLLIGRVSERTKTAARLEILSLQHGMRDTHPRFEVYPIQDDVSTSLHAITKRIAFATSSASGDRVQTTLSQASLIQGNEIYGAFDVSAS